MKTVKVVLLVILTNLFLYFNLAKAQIPTYNLKAKNFELNSIAYVDDAIEFDIYLENTTSPPEDIEYASGQYYFNFNSAIASGNSDLEYTKLESVLPPSMQPSSPRLGIPSDPNINILSLAYNSFPGYGNGFIIPPTVFPDPGIKIVRMRLRRLSGTINLDELELEWRNSSHGAPFTRIYAYLPLPDPATDITNPSNHTIEYGVLPVELSNFSSSVNRNVVILNWSTAKEINNSQFDIERKSSNSTDWLKSGGTAGNGTTKDIKNYTFSERLPTGKYEYRLKQIDYNGNYAYFNLSNEVEVGIPQVYDLSQNYPNPFNPTTKINFDLPEDGKVNLILYDITGREISKIVNEVKTAGYYTVEFNANNIASGIYFYRITSGNFVAVKKMAVIK